MHKPTQQTVYIHRVNQRDEIVWVNEAWLRFARENAAPELTRDSVLSRPIWQFLTDVDTVHVYQLVLNEVRASGRSVTLPFRCDSPTRRRFMSLEIVPGEGGTVDFLSRIVRQEERDYQPLLDRAREHTFEVVKLCAWCKRLLLPPTRWVGLEEGVQALDLFSQDVIPHVTHGMCPHCYEDRLARLTSGGRPAHC